MIYLIILDYRYVNINKTLTVSCSVIN